MPQKLKFKPVISRVKLNPEQAVLACYGYVHSHHQNSFAGYKNFFNTCTGGAATRSTAYNHYWDYKDTFS